MHEEKNVTSMLIVSLLLLWITWPWPTTGTLFFSGFLGGLVYYLPPRYTAIELAWYFVNRLHILTFILTITFATLHQSNIGRKKLLYKLSVYLFIASMISIFITFAQMLIGLPYRY
jgi:uncharacterized membrane protein